MSLKKWKKLDQKTVFNNDHWKYNLDNFEIEDGTKGEYHYVHYNWIDNGCSFYI